MQITKITSVDISEFSNTDLITSLAFRDLNEKEQQILFNIVENMKKTTTTSTSTTSTSTTSTSTTTSTTTTLPQIIFYSDYKSFQVFIDSAILLGVKGIINRDVIIDESIVIEGDIILELAEGYTITQSTNTTYGFILGEGIHNFYYFRCNSLHLDDSESAMFFTKQDTNILWHNHFFDLYITGGAMGYSSSRGGSPDHMNLSNFTNCNLDNTWINISIYSQDGPFKALHLDNVILKTAKSHNIYVHPAVSLHYNNVKSLGAGKLMQHQYSGSGNGGYGTGIYTILNNIDSGDYMFELTSLANNEPIKISDSVISPYVTMGVPPAYVEATDVTFSNKGNGIYIQGRFENCSGGLWGTPGYPIDAFNCQFDEISFRIGGDFKFRQCEINGVWGADRDVNPIFNLNFDTCTIAQMAEGGYGTGKIILKNTPMPVLSPGFRTELIEVIE